MIAFADRLRPDTSAALAELAALGIKSSIFSGDSVPVVATIARATGLTTQATALPADKQAAIERLRGAGRHVLMAGGGLNDGSALATAIAGFVTPLFAAFFWALNRGQFSDLDGAAARILIDEDDTP